MYSRRKVCESEKFSPRNSPTWTGLTRFSSRKLLSSTGKSRTAPVATRKARPCPGRWLKISTPRSISAEVLHCSFITAARGTKNGSKRKRAETLMSSPSSHPSPKLQGSSAPRVRRCAAQEPMASRSQTSLQRSEGARPLRFLGARSAPLCISHTATLRRPMKNATCKGVHPATSVAFSGKSRRMSSRTTAKDPLRHAACNAVVPLVSQASKFAPRRKTHLTTTRLEDEAKVSSSRSTSFKSSSVS
mmetsp:Transcript_21105/g.58487  ORF Transcript_21105/g.58487 Transcript_21105/m.58487 type:complete len:246 (-) Transcript_21105:240-977(-)